MNRPSDYARRLAIVQERRRNVVANAGAGTGKTHTLVSRLIHLVAPENTSDEPLQLDQIAAITFTRRAAGELKLQVRRRLQEERDKAAPGSNRCQRLEHALDSSAGAFIGTIHGFCRRLLLSRPVETGLGPSLEAIEDLSPLMDWTSRTLFQLVQTGRTPAFLGVVPAPWIDQAQTTIEIFLKAGLLIESKDRGYHTDAGLDALVRQLIHQRGLWIPSPKPPADVTEVELGRIRQTCQELRHDLHRLSGSQTSIAILQRFARELGDVQTSTSCGEMFCILMRAFSWIRSLPYSPSDPAYPQDDDLAWAVVKALSDDPFRRPKTKPYANRQLRSELTLPLNRWMAERLLALAPLVEHLYEARKRGLGVWDQTDMLLKLRNALRDLLPFRRYCQGLFRQILVDECQDTDPLQMEIISFLAEGDGSAVNWRSVKLRPGFLTVVGDPKQSIYRFRRADVRAYRAFVDLLQSQGALVEKLQVNFRSRPELVAQVFNRQGQLLFSSLQEKEAVSQVAYDPLEPWVEIPKAPTPVVHRLRYGPAQAIESSELRRQEAQAIASHLAFLLSGPCTLQLRRETDSGSLALGRPRPQDIAVLCRNTTNLPLLTQSLDRHQISYVQRGGVTAFADPWIKRFLTALRAVADPDDGPARAAFFHLPFFGISPTQLPQHTPSDGPVNANDPLGHVGIRQATHLLDELRQKRFERSVSETARELATRSGFGAFLATRPNGHHRINVLHQAILWLQRQADQHQLDFHRATALAVASAAQPPRFDPAQADDLDAIRIFTTHQAKGLEFPVVVLWDALSDRKPTLHDAALLFGSDGKDWRMSLHGLEVASEKDPAPEERALALQEIDRLYYVAITRARDILVIPQPCALPIRCRDPYHSKLLSALDPDTIATFCYEPSPSTPAPVESLELWGDDGLEEEVLNSRRQMSTALAQLGQPRLAPVAPSALAHRLESAVGADVSACDPHGSHRVLAVENPLRHPSEEVAKDKSQDESGRYGREFGTMVHRSMELVLMGFSVLQAVQSAQLELGILADAQQATDDVQRALQALDQLGLLQQKQQLFPEYPLSGLFQSESGTYLLSGQLDLLAMTDEDVVIIDYKTDQPPTGQDRPRPAYIRQLQLYGNLLQQSRLLRDRRLRLYLLYTANGSLYSI